jgi:hypothetical protein
LDRAAFTVTREQEKGQTSPAHRKRMAGEKTEALLTSGPSGSMANDQRSSSLCLTALRLMARLALVAA